MAENDLTTAGQPGLPQEPGRHETTAARPDIDWQETALRLQAEMENFRKRQARRADEAISDERARLLKRFLPVVDNLERALKHQTGHDQRLREGLELTYRELLRLLQSEGVARLETLGRPLDPDWHEAIATMPAGQERGTIVEEVEPGYKLGDKLLRPARVVVAA